MAYAENTTVPIERSIAEIVGLVKRAGAERVAQYEDRDSFSIAFDLGGRHIRFRVALPDIDAVPAVRGDGRRRTTAELIAKRDALQRQRARALLLVIKAKLESVESRVETFEEAFLANIIMADGATVYERIAEPIAVEYASGRTDQLLLAGPDQSPNKRADRN
jgi:hypothetical protein